MSLTLKLSAALSVVLLAAVAGCNQSPQSKAPVKRAPSQASLKWQQTANGFAESYFAAQPLFAAQAGKHQYDGQLPDLSAHGIKREIARLHDLHDQLTAVDPMMLEPGERFDREYLLGVRQQGSVLVGKGALSVDESLLVPRDSRSRRVLDA